MWTRRNALFSLLAFLGGMAGGWSAGAAWAQEAEYKRFGRDAMVQIVDGKVDAAIEALHRHLDAYPNDPEFYYGLAVAHAQKQELDVSLAYAQRAVGTGLPVGRLLAGPRGLLRPLTETTAFRSWLDSLDISPLVHGPLLGQVTDSSASFWVRTRDETPVAVFVQDAAGQRPPRLSDRVMTRKDEDYTARITVRGLRPDTEYTYHVLIDAVGQQEVQSFRTFPADGSPARFQIGFGGCAGYTPWNERMWTTIEERRPLAFLTLGDNVYIDNPTRPDVQRYCYYRRQSRPEFRSFSAKTPLFAIWDDHDFGENDSRGGPDVDTPAWKRPVWQVFKQNWNNPGYGGGEEHPGVWFTFSVADVDFFMLDGRYYREDPTTDSPSMLGLVQKAWLLDQLASSTATFKVIASPVPWAFGAKGGTQMTPEGPQPGGLDIWEGFPDEREEIFSFLEANDIDGVVLLSSDRHRSDLWKIERPEGYDLYEFESGKLTNVHTHDLMPGALFGYNEKHSFGLLTFDTTLPDPEVTYRIVNIDGEVVHAVTLKRSQLTHE